MKTLLAIIIATAALPALAVGDHARKGHVTKNGTYVAPSRATNPDGKRSNNYSHSGNVNPHNGKVGRRK